MRNNQLHSLLAKARASFSFASLEGCNQFLMLLVGLMVVRNMPVVEYGYYTICIATVGMCNALANSGLSSGFRKIGGEVHADPRCFSALYVSAVKERRVQTLFVVPMVVLVVFLFLYRQEGLVGKALVLSLLVGLSALPELWRAIAMEVLLLKSAWRTVQLQNLLSVVLRIILVAGLLVFGLSAENVLLVNVCVIALTGWLTYRAAVRRLSLPADPNTEQRREIRHIMSRVMPNAIFSVTHQQLGTFLLATRGSVTSVADLGALTRLTAIFSIGVSAVAQIIAPKFAKTHAPTAMQRLYVGTLVVVAVVVVIVLVVAAMFPAQLLWILGPKYEHLQTPLFLAACLVMLQFAKSVTARMNQAKAWILRAAKWNIPLTLGAIGLGIWFFNTSTLIGVLAIMLVSGLPMLLLYLWDASRGLRAVKVAAGG